MRSAVSHIRSAMHPSVEEVLRLEFYSVLDLTGVFHRLISIVPDDVRLRGIDPHCIGGIVVEYVNSVAGPCHQTWTACREEEVVW